MKRKILYIILWIFLIVIIFYLFKNQIIHTYYNVFDKNLENKKPDNIEMVWIEKKFTLGRQCSGIEPEIPDVKKILNKAGIEVFETKDGERLYDITAVCGAPTYIRTHYALIKKQQLQDAQKLGFILSN